jgi:hypothetical protein
MSDLLPQSPSSLLIVTDTLKAVGIPNQFFPFPSLSTKAESYPSVS